MASQTDTLVSILQTKIDAANSLATEAQKVLGNSAKTLREARDNSDDAKVVEFRKWLERAEAQIEKKRSEIDNYIRESLGLSGAWTEDEVKAKRAEHKTLRDEIKELRSVVEGMAKFTGESLPELPDVLNFSGTVSTGGATGTRRLRLDKVEVNGKEVDNLSAVASLIKRESGKPVATADLQKVIFEKAGTDDVSKFPNDINFEWSETDSEGVTHKYDVTVYKFRDTTAEEAKAGTTE